LSIIATGIKKSIKKEFGLHALKWLKLDVETDYDGKLPFFTGSMLRGVIGHALKKVVCINPSYKCEGCFAAKECLYHQFYEEKNTFHDYRFGITLQPKELFFSLYLFEDAVASLPYILSAIQKALEEVGLGKENKLVKLRRISIGGRTLYDGKEFLSLEGIKASELEIDRLHRDVRLHLNMPLRIKENNQFAREGVALHTLIGNIHSRYTQLKGEKPSRLGYRVHGEITRSSLKFVEMQRYSNRQHKGMNIGGLKGDLEITGLDKQSYVYLKIGEIIGAGKQTVFGLGDYTLIPKEEVK